MTQATESPDRRLPLSKERVLAAAVALADRDGIESLSMRKLGQELGVEAMSLYRHVRGKDDLLDGIVEAVVAEIPITPPSDDWRAAMRAQVHTARGVMLAHPWAPRQLEERTTVGPATLHYIDGILAILFAGGFPVDLAHHVLHVMGSRILGFTQDLFDDAADPRPTPEEAEQQARAMDGAFPQVARLARAVNHEGALGGCDDDFEFAFGLDLILDGLERRRAKAHKRA